MFSSSTFKNSGRFFALIAAYGCLLILASLIALLLRFDFVVAQNYWKSWLLTLIWLIPLKLILLGVFGQYRSLLTYFSYPDAKCIALSQFLAALIAAAVWIYMRGAGVMPRGVIVTDCVLSILLIIFMRMGMRRFRENKKMLDDRRLHTSKRVLIIGAGEAGATLAREIQSKPGLGMEVVCFVDDKPQLKGQLIHGLQVIGDRHELAKIIPRLEITRAIIAMPQASPSIIRETIEILNAAGVENDILPSIGQLLHRKVTVNNLRPVNPEDLLGREAVPLNNEEISKLLCNKVVMVTGAGGSIGSELCRQIASHAPKMLILMERSEPSLFKIEQELLHEELCNALEPLATSVCNKERVEAIFNEYKPEIIFHAAANKHVPLMEHQPAEAIRNNDIGTMVVALAASRHGAERFVLVSTDKAVNPTNVMGATKRVAEMVAQAIQHSEGNRTIYSAVRFGNVLGSSGSVIPTFKKQISEGGPITVTHPDVTRYFMSIPEAVGLILQSATQAKGGEINVLDMGQPIKIRDLAAQMIQLSGLIPDKDIKIEYRGLRPGEKLYEEPIHEGENIRPTSHPKIKWLDRSCNGKDILSELNALSVNLYSHSNDELKAWLNRIVPEYTPWKG
jgi:nucleoside-diphosphate-sugar epimerase